MSPVSLDQPWGRGSKARHAHFFSDGHPPPGTGYLPRGLGRSYGDVCVNAGGALLHTFRRDRLLAFDPVQGVLTCEGGASLADVAQVMLPLGWFPSVVPGTRYVTVGGAIANDVHGKNHHVAGTFGRAVQSFLLHRSNGELCRVECGAPLHAATIGGLGLTGVIEEATMSLTRVPGPGIAQETRLFGGDGSIDEYLALDEASAPWAYNVGWIDTLDRGLRGVFFRGEHCDGPDAWLAPRAARVTMPVDAPQWVLGRWSAKAFNAAYYRAQATRSARRETIPLWQFFFPLDAVNAWNRAYGRRGFIQYQFVVPDAAARETVPRLLAHLREARVASYLAVIKKFGSVRSPGLLSFPIAGTTVALDIPAPNGNDLRALDRADAMVADVGGRVYPAKDSRMSSTMFQRFFPQWRELEAMRDPAISSSFWRRVTATPSLKL